VSLAGLGEALALEDVAQMTVAAGAHDLDTAGPVVLGLGGDGALVAPVRVRARDRLRLRLRVQEVKTL
jgi:hypothetical protein